MRTRVRMIGGAAVACTALGIAAGAAFGTGDTSARRHPWPPTPTASASASAGTPTPTSTSTTKPAPTPTRTSRPGPTPAAPNPDCTLVVPANPLSAAGLATPYQLTATDAEAGPCRETDADQSAFVQAVVIDPATGTLGVYSPLVVDRGRTPAVAPVVPKLAPGAVVGIWFGSNGSTLTLSGPGAASCVNGSNGSKFGQYAYCGAAAFYAAADAAIAAKRLTVPPLGTAADGMPCPTTRDFSVVDQDQSDNVNTTYVALRDGRTAQNTVATMTALSGRTPHLLDNGSDNRLLDAFVDPALHCTPFTAPDIADPGKQVSALPLNELQAAAFQQNAALVPPSDPMTLVGTRLNAAKTNLYRVGVDQPALASGANLRQLATSYCASMTSVGAKRIETDKKFTVGFASPDPADADLYAFLKARFTASLQNLNCQKAEG